MASHRSAQIKEIADRLGLSVGTVSIVLNGRGDKMRISKKTQERVRNVAREMDYQPNIYARRLRNAGVEGTSRVIAVFWNSGYADEIMGSFFRALQQMADEACQHVEFYVHMFEFGHLCECEQLMTPVRCSGIIICGISDADAEYLNSRQFDIPVVCAFRREEHYHCVYVDDYAIGANTADMFALRGHKTAGFIGSRQSGPNSVLRKKGFLDKCRELGIELQDAWIKEDAKRDFYSGFRLMERLLEAGNRPTAVFVNVPDQALGATVACEKHRIRFQEEIELVSIGSGKIFELFSPSISLVCTPVELVAENTLRLLLDAIEGGSTEPVHCVLDAKYTAGDTCGLIS